MDRISFDKLLLKTAFCCMASDGHVDQLEVDAIKKLCQESPLFANFDFNEEISLLADKINAGAKDFYRKYFELLHNAHLSEEEELNLIDFAIRTINADDQIEYAEIKFFKNIRCRLKISDEKILERFPGLEIYLEEDIVIETNLDKILNQYFEIAEIKHLNLNQFLNEDGNANVL